MQYCMFDERAFPSLLCFVVGDSWQRELVFRVAGLYGLADRLQVHCLYDGSISGVREWHGGRGWVGQVLEGGSLGNTTLERRIASGLRGSGAMGSLTSRLLDGVLEWPGMGIRFGQKLVGESGDSGRVRKAMGALVDAGMVRRGSSRGAHSHVMDGPGFEVLRRRDRVECAPAAP